ncbi:MAG: GTPase Era, partial [Clostridiales bacterium]|nr:GTPase Era [Clostridiales bacterium]
VKVYLNLWVKVKSGWRDNNFNLREFGYNIKDLN